MAWGLTENHLAVTSWEGDVHVLSVNAQNNSVASVQAAHNPPMKMPQPILCSAWTRSMELLLGTCEGKLLAWDVQKGANAGAVAERGRHEGGIKFCKALHNEDGWSINGILTGSWDKTVALWDVRQGSLQPMSKIKVPGKVYGMDVLCPYFLVAGSDRLISLHDVRNGAQCVASFPSYSPLMFQTRSACLISNLNNGMEPQGFAVGGINGELGVVMLRQGEGPQQRKILLTQPAMAGQPQSSARAVNVVTRMPNHPNLVVAGGGDGRFTVWNVGPVAAGGQKGFFGDGTPEYKSEDPRNSLPPATNPAIQAKVWPSISCLSWSQKPNSPAIMAFANSSDSSGGAPDYMSSDQHVASLENIVRFWML
ncbi:hypothetical protein GUITHDRAFT_108842 [Guillardia theta CCMP2712]|uniref:Uncharacterized protein n=1 Tax=Guillardia theta (strain CCMP2712) TaxID=905079 RepID=L1JAT2_GUITC|nr:hypothetical protein GUITHDRAFT_108842 [Guillardia theta CCMP2712]EKX45200.1 hypothetical protein GUITHDRAFT_108842 [Guillardia theta CCMP2712]|eukprot:XP_005832180.1 hypothetical protein GUITHDRAFT_108842 [Guillardia theta CCMP2712]